jgi:hypothetical protein
MKKLICFVAIEFLLIAFFGMGFAVVNAYEQVLSFDPSPIELPKELIEQFLANTKSPKDFTRSSWKTIHFSKEKNVTIQGDSSSSTCLDLNEQELVNLFSKLLHKRLNNLNMMIVPALNGHSRRDYHRTSPNILLNSSSTINKQTITGSYGFKECKLRTYKILNNTMPLCPWHYVIIERANKFPHTRANAVCNCKESCLNSNSNFRCSPIRIPMPVLIRGKCNPKRGYYEWMDAIEDINIGCVCTRNQQDGDDT